MFERVSQLLFLFELFIRDLNNFIQVIFALYNSLDPNKLPFTFEYLPADTGRSSF